MTLSGNFEHAHARSKLLTNCGLYLRRCRLTAKVNTVGTCTVLTGLNARLDHRTLELREHAQHLEHRLAACRGRVETLLQKEQIHLGAMQLLLRADKIRQ